MNELLRVLYNFAIAIWAIHSFYKAFQAKANEEWNKGLWYMALGGLLVWMSQ